MFSFLNIGENCFNKSVAWKWNHKDAFEHLTFKKEKDSVSLFMVFYFFYFLILSFDIVIYLSFAIINGNLLKEAAGKIIILLKRDVIDITENAYLVLLAARPFINMQVSNNNFNYFKTLILFGWVFVKCWWQNFQCATYAVFGKASKILYKLLFVIL